jgi:hypothetical protein
MAKMIGKVRYLYYPQCRFGCCKTEVSKKHVLRDEEAQWRQEAFDEMDDPAHESGMCSDPVTGQVGCNYCDPEWAWLPNGFAEDLEDIEGVTTNMKTLGSYE